MVERARKRLAFEEHALPVDHGLDGDVWCYGYEEDAGPRSIFDADDAMPWAAVRLARNSRADPFLPQEGELVLRGISDTNLVIRYVVEPAP